MLQLWENWTYCKKLLRKNNHLSYGSTRILWFNERRGKRGNEKAIGFCQELAKDSPTSLVPEQCIYENLVPTKYLSLNSIIYEIKEWEGKIRNTSIRDKQNKLKNNLTPWMI